MNRIREIRERLGLTTRDLADLVGTSHASIARYETGERKLTVDMARRIATALGVTPADLISNIALADMEDDIEPVTDEALLKVFAGLQKRGLAVYAVAGSSVERVGIVPGDQITVDSSQAAIDAIRTGDVVVLDIHGFRLLRQFVGPSLFVTNRVGANYTVDATDTQLKPKVVGVVVRETN